MKIQRNAPCPCGSARKYKQCCLPGDREEAARIRAIEERGRIFTRLQNRVERWLVEQDLVDAHLDEWLAVELSGVTDEWLHERLDQQPAYREQLWDLAADRLLFEGDLPTGDPRGRAKARELLLDRSSQGPSIGIGGLGEEERVWLDGWLAAPLRVYEVVATERGVAVTLQDLSTGESTRILEPDIRRAPEVEELVVTRIASGPEGERRATAMWPITRAGLSRSGYLALAASVGAEDPLRLVDDLAREAWIESVVLPFPTFVDQRTIDEMEFVTHHFRIADWRGVEQAFDAAVGWQGSREHGWQWTAEPSSTSGRRRVLARCRSDPRHPDRLLLASDTRAKAEVARAWFERSCGGAAGFLAAEITDPTSGCLAYPILDPDRIARAAAQAGIEAAEHLTPEQRTHLAESAYRDLHHDFFDRRLPELCDVSPGEALELRELRRDVVLLIGAHQRDEERMAALDRRPAADLSFLYREMERRIAELGT
ncbi:MAG: hypothetical protein DWQ36_20010 [Acidobacteria bacterium]|nr:MAG: hypothetical protein DWQ30_08355 [Acidobacteriota bacterium]REK03574.1 MAG: hypothetical protein DWQ36_20010 [Acidobacteriota bacterium]